MSIQCFPSPDAFETYARQGNLVPVYADLMADFETPVSAYAKLNQHGPAFLFESIEGGEHIGRYTFLGCQPRKIFKIFADRTFSKSKHSDWIESPTPADPLDLIEDEMQPYQPVHLPDMPPFIGGAVGALGYEYIHHVEESVPPAPGDPLQMPVLFYLITDSVVIFDRARQTLRIVVNAHIQDDPHAAYLQAVHEISSIVLLLSRKHPLAPAPLLQPDSHPSEVPKGNFSQSEFERLVDQSKFFIEAGDVIQVVLSQRFAIPYKHAPLDLYRALRVINPSPYMFLLEADGFAVIGASPEVHVRLTGRRAELRPIAGTRPRGTTAEEDLALEKDLLGDEKERAEHLMLVDLARNDLGRVCAIGSVNVPEYMVIERYSHVMHIVSQVIGELAEGKNAFDLMRATFPAGTVSGAPKVRAMQIISELEGSRRGIYAGALGYFSYDGNCDSCIAIRTALLKENTLYVQSGAGLVADSIPENEYHETLNKARGLLKAVTLSEMMKD